MGRAIAAAQDDDSARAVSDPLCSSGNRVRVADAISIQEMQRFLVIGATGSRGSNSAEIEERPTSRFDTRLADRSKAAVRRTGVGIDPAAAPASSIAGRARRQPVEQREFRRQVKERASGGSEEED